MEKRRWLRKCLKKQKRESSMRKTERTEKNNIIIYRVEENASSSSDDRQKYDKQYVKELTKEVLRVYCNDDDIKRVIRLGAKGSIARPLLVEYRSHIIKNQLLESLHVLKSADDRF